MNPTSLPWHQLLPYDTTNPLLSWHPREGKAEKLKKNRVSSFRKNHSNSAYTHSIPCRSIPVVYSVVIWSSRLINQGPLLSCRRRWMCCRWQPDSAEYDISHIYLSNYFVPRADNLETARWSDFFCQSPWRQVSFQLRASLPTSYFGLSQFFYLLGVTL